MTKHKTATCSPHNYTIDERLDQMNDHFGRGKVLRMVLADDGCSGYVVRRIEIIAGFGPLERRRFRVVGDTLHFLGHQSNLKRDMKL